MNCPHCGSNQTQIRFSSKDRDGRRLRRHKCFGCGKRFKTLDLQLEQLPVCEGDCFNCKHSDCIASNALIMSFENKR